MPCLVAGLERLARLAHDVDRLVDGEPGAPEAVAEPFALEELHEQVDEVVTVIDQAAEVDHLDDVLGVDLVGGLGLGEQASDDLLLDAASSSCRTLAATRRLMSGCSHR